MSAPVHPLLSHYLAAVLAGDRTEALRVVVDDGIKCGMSVRELDLDVVAAAQREIGSMWQKNEISVAHEHQATAIAQVVLAHLYPSLERAPRVNRKVLVACVENELHDMAARIASDLLDSYGFDTAFLGANFPIAELVPTIRRTKADALALSVTKVFHIDTARRAVREVRAEVGPAFPILVGGEAVIAIPDEASFEGAVVSRGTAADLAARLRSMLGIEEPEA